MSETNNDTTIADQIHKLQRKELEEITASSLDAIQKIMTALKKTGHDYLLSEIIVDNEETNESRNKKLSKIRDASSIISEDTCSTMRKLESGSWAIKSLLLDEEVQGLSAFDVVINYIQSLEGIVMDRTYEKDIRSTMDIALRRAQEGMDGINAGRALFDKGGIEVWIEVIIQNGTPRWIIDPSEDGSTVIHRKDEDAIVRVISSMITDKIREDKRKRD